MIVLLTGLVALLALASGVGTAFLLDLRRSAREARARDAAESDKLRSTISVDAEKILKGTGMDDSTRLGIYNLDELSVESLRIVNRLVYDLELAHRMHKSDIVSGSVGNSLRIATEALDKIKSASSEAGYDSGHAGVHKLACDALRDMGVEADATCQA